ncbi:MULTISPECIES: helix-turn-helix domain-containing protein [unclassified Enterococcus]|uniref:helix-turn-helix domain-containing protein n=1 Tax=unclassified Enterococcus TaxID=2608891 RepID=UPI001CE0F40C|nr:MULTISPECIES: AraC family transcriptional regulator [unclassified Enterococcus]MCA5011684.1 helix-turn-helix transcriptional regulator [Enterococcus sp. S23]MCA5014874.1 helix-turn-helix transcriptional regulator [Enterococcus sp. S22(2020)]
MHSKQGLKTTITKYFTSEIEEKMLYPNEELTLLMVISGQIELILLDQYVVLKKGEIYLLNKNEMMSVFPSSKNQVLSVSLNITPEKWLNCRFKQPNPLTISSEKIYQEIVKCLLYKEHPQYLLKLLLRNQIIFIEKTLRVDGSPFTDFIEILEYINKNYIEEHCLEKLVEHFMLDKYTLFQNFRKCTGFSIQIYLREVRLFYSVRLLKKTNAKIMDIALDTGFSSLRAFNKSFKDKFGLPPLSFRKQHKLCQKNSESEFELEQVEQFLERKIDQTT